MNFDKLTKIILKEAHVIPSKLEVKKRLDDIEKKYGYLRQDEDFLNKLLIDNMIVSQGVSNKFMMSFN